MQLVDAIRKCTKCSELSANRKNVVIGDGPIPCPIVFLGEAPGAMEDRTGKAFCGLAGEILNIAAHQCNLTRGVDYHTLNVLKCRPPDNRNPSREELLNCSKFLTAQLATVNPKVVLALGKYAQGYILQQPPQNVSALRNAGKVIRLKNFVSVLTYHPSFIRRMDSPDITKAFKKHINLVKKLVKGD